MPKYFLNSITLTVISMDTPVDRADELGEMTDLCLATFDVQAKEITEQRAITLAEECGAGDFYFAEQED